MRTTHADHHYSVSYFSEDLGAVYCLRGLSQYCQKTGNARIPWGGTGRDDWLAKKKVVTFHFSQTSYRNNFISEVERLIPASLVKQIAASDNDPATPVENS
jgi:hypothetical protein